jgi:hypothetical protein
MWRMGDPLVTPHTIEAEVAVLGGILINDARLFEVVDVLDAGTSTAMPIRKSTARSSSCRRKAAPSIS